MTVGEKIRNHREQENMTQSELGKACGVTKQTIFKYETGIVTNIPIDKLQRIAAALNISAAYLMGWKDDPKPESDKKGAPALSESAVNLMKIIDDLNSESQKALADYAKVLLRGQSER